MYTFAVAAPAGALDQAPEVIWKDMQASKYSNCTASTDADSPCRHGFDGCSALQSTFAIFYTCVLPRTSSGVAAFRSGAHMYCLRASQVAPV